MSCFRINCLHNEYLLAAIALLLISIAGPSVANAQVDLKGDKMFFGKEVIEFGELAKQVSEFSKVNIQIPDNVKPKNKVFVLSSEGFDKKQSYKLFMMLAESMGMTFTAVGPYKKFGAAKDLDTYPSQVYVQNIPVFDESQPQVTLLYRLQHVSGEEMRKVLEPFRSAKGKIHFIGQNLLIVDFQHAIPRLARFIKEFDVGGPETKIYYWVASHSPVEDVAKIVDDLFLKARQGSAQAVGLEKIVTDERSNGMFIIGTEEACKRVAAFVPKLDISILRTATMDVVFLSFAKAEELASTIQNIVKGRSKKRSARRQFGEDLEVNISADKQTNSLVLSGPARGIKEIKTLIEKLDRFPRQVFLEVVVLEVTIGENSRQGIATMVTKKVGDETYAVVGSNYSSVNALAVNPATMLGLAMGTQVGKVEGTDEAFGLGYNFPKFGMILQMLQTNSDVNVISNPYLLSMDAEEAELIVGSNVPFVTGSARDSYNQPVLSIQRQDVALSVKIKPEINESSRVKVEIEITVEDLASISEVMGPTTSKRAIKTVAIAEDGSRLALGGLIKTKHIEGKEKIPVLGDIPIVGRLFQTDTSQGEKVNLMAVITPHIVDSEEDLKRIFKQKLKERSEYIREMYGEEDQDFEVAARDRDGVGLVETLRQVADEQKMEAAGEKRERVLIITPNEQRRVPAESIEGNLQPQEDTENRETTGNTSPEEQ